MKGLQSLGINASVYPIYIWNELDTRPEIHVIVLAVWVSLVLVDLPHKIKNYLIASGLM